MPDIFEMPSWFHEPTGVLKAREQDDGRKEGSIWCLSYYRSDEMICDFVWALKLDTNNYRFFKEEKHAEAFLVLREMDRPTKRTQDNSYIGNFTI